MEEVKTLLFPSSTFLLSSGEVLDLIYEDHGGRSRIRKFTGVCISFSNKIEKRCILRNVFNGLAVEVSFPASSKVVISLLRSVRYKSFQIRRSKLFYLRNKRLVESRVS